MSYREIFGSTTTPRRTSRSAACVAVVTCLVTAAAWAGPPTGGTFDVTPGAGETAVDSFTLSVLGWTDEPGHLPLTYQYYYDTGSGDVPLGPPSADTVLVTALPAGESAPYEVTVSVCVRDNIDNETCVPQIIVVEPSAPIAGTLDVSPSVAVALVTEITMTATDWVDLQVNLPLTYRFFMDNGGGEQTLGAQSQVNVYQGTFPVGLGIGGQIEVGVYISDSLAHETRVSDSVYVCADGAPCGPVAVPTVSVWGLTVMVLLCMAGGTLVFRRKPVSH